MKELVITYVRVDVLFVKTKNEFLTISFGKSPYANMFIGCWTLTIGGVLK